MTETADKPMTATEAIASQTKALAQYQRNVSYQIEYIQGGMVHALETFDLTNPTGPGILVRYGKPVDIEDIRAEGIVSATRRISMTEQQAFDCGLIVREKCT